MLTIDDLSNDVVENITARVGPLTGKAAGYPSVADVIDTTLQEFTRDADIDASARFRELADCQRKVEELEKRLAERDREIGKLRAEIDLLQKAVLPMTRFEMRELRHHSSRLVELLRDAWWVEAADHLHQIRRLTREDV